MNASWRAATPFRVILGADVGCQVLLGRRWQIWAAMLESALGLTICAAAKTVFPDRRR